MAGRWAAWLVFAGVLPMAPGCDAPSVAADTTTDGAANGTTRTAHSGAYVDDAVCLKCHRDVAEGFFESGMSRTFVPATAEHMFEDFEDVELYHPKSQRHYVMSERDGEYFVRRYQTDPDGTRFNEHEQKIEYVIGSGHHSRTYLFRNPAGEIYQMPVAWQAETESWTMHGGYDKRRHRGFKRQIERECFSCHHAYPSVPEGHDRFGFPHLFPETLPAAGIGCQRCHGPGEEHVRLARDFEVSDEVVLASAVNPARLDHARSDDVCLQCHLQPATNLSSRNTRFGYGHFDFDAGERLSDQYFYVAFGTEADQAALFQANHQPFRLAMSDCWQKSEGRLTCITCHNPHHLPPPADTVSFYREKCFTCHDVDACDLERMTNAREQFPLVADVPADDCISCHMPKRRAQDLVREIVTEHAISRRPPVTDLLAPIAETEPNFLPPSAYRPEDAPPPDEADILLALVGLRARPTTERTGQFDTLMRATGSREVEALTYFAAVQRVRGNINEAIAASRQAIDVAPNRSLLHVELGKLQILRGAFDDARQAFERAIALEPRLPEGHAGLGEVFARTNRTPEAIAAYREAVRLRPEFVNARLQIAMLHLGRRELESAVRELERLIAFEPSTEIAYLQCGAALTILRRYDEAIRLYRRGARVASAPGPMIEAVATTQALAGRFDDALRTVEHARRLPGTDEVNCLLVTALSQHGRGGGDEAAQTMRTASELARQRPSSTITRGMLMNHAQRALGSGPKR